MPTQQRTPARQPDAAEPAPNRAQGPNRARAETIPTDFPEPRPNRTRYFLDCAPVRAIMDPHASLGPPSLGLRETAIRWDFILNTDIDVPVDASAATDRDSWLALIDQIGEEEGYFQTVGPRHWAMFVDDGATLVVSFETVASARARQGQMPLAHHIAAEKGWSHLCLIAEDLTWFRDTAVYAWFDRLVDDAFFEDFDRVLFYGAGPMGYAACAYSVAAPGAQVLALAPFATLNPEIAGWDDRFKRDRSLDFTSRYGFAPDMIDGCATLSLVCDPYVRPDAMHAALFHAPHTRLLPTRYAGPDPEAALARLGILDEAIIQAAEARLTPASFALLWRKRHGDATYLKSLLQAVEATGSRARVVALCENVFRRLRLTRFRKRLLEVTAASTPAPDKA